MILNDWSARDLQREETTVRLGPAKGKDFASSIGPWLVTPDELADARNGKGYDLTMTAHGQRPGAIARRRGPARISASGRCSSAPPPTSASSRRPAGLGTVGTGCLLEIRDETLGRCLQPGDEVTLAIERLGELTSPVVERPTR